MEEMAAAAAAAAEEEAAATTVVHQSLGCRCRACNGYAKWHCRELLTWTYLAGTFVPGWLTRLSQKKTKKKEEEEEAMENERKKDDEKQKESFRRGMHSTRDLTLIATAVQAATYWTNGQKR